MLSKLMLGTRPGLRADVAAPTAPRVAGTPRTPTGAPSGKASTVSARLTEAAAESAPAARTSAVSVTGATAQAWTKNRKSCASTPVTARVWVAVPQAPTPTAVALSLDTITW